MSYHDYPEIAMREIREGDVIREEFAGPVPTGLAHAEEYVAAKPNPAALPPGGSRYFLVYRKPEMVEVPKEALDSLEASALGHPPYAFRASPTLRALGDFLEAAGRGNPGVGA